MTTADTPSAVQRKLTAASGDAKSGERSALRALRLAFARAASQAFDLPLAVIGTRHRRVAADDVPQFFRSDWLLLLLDGPGGQRGAALLDPDCITALIQHQTMGQVTGGDITPRPFTETDAAMAAPLIDAVLTRAADLAQVTSDKLCLAGYQFGARADDVHSLSVALEADRFRVFDLALDIASGAMQGSVCLILPEPFETADQDESRPSGPRMDQAVGGAAANLNAVICRIRMSVTDLSTLAVGDVVPLTQGRIDKTEVLAISGQRITVGQLGQAGGFKAVRLAGYVPQVAEKSHEFAMSLGLPAPQKTSGAIAEPEHRKTSQSTILDGTVLTGDDAGFAPDSFAAQLDEEDEKLFSGLSAEDAALEISELAGLSEHEPDKTGPDKAVPTSFNE